MTQFTSTSDLLAFETAHPGSRYSDNASDEFRFADGADTSPEVSKYEDILVQLEESGDDYTSRDLNWLAFPVTTTREAALIPTPGEAAAVPEGSGYVSKERVAEVMRAKAIENNWCPDHHRALRDLNIEPLAAEREFEMTITIKGTMARNYYMQSWEQFSDEGLLSEFTGGGISSTRQLPHRLGLETTALQEKLQGLAYNGERTKATVSTVTATFKTPAAAG